MKRILHVIESLAPSGALSQLSLLLRRLPRDEFDSQVCTLGPPRPALAGKSSVVFPDIPVTQIERTRGFDLAALCQLRDTITYDPFDVVHAWQPAVHRMTQLAAHWANGPRIVISHRRAPREGGRVLPWLDPWLTQCTQAVLVNDPALLQTCRQQGVSAERLTLIADGVELPTTKEPARESLLAKLGLPAGTRLVGTVGRFTPAERLKDAIWSADLLKVIRDDVHLLMIGDGEQRARLERYRQQVEIADRVYFLAPCDNLPQLLSQLDVYWQTRDGAGRPLALVTAMASGVPTVVADNPSTRPLIVPGRNGYLFTPGDRAVLAKLTQRLLNDADLARTIGIAGRETALAQCSAETMVASYADFYRQL